jgi:hypothetical protein
MRLADLRNFILTTRQTEGVNWFLTDVTPHLKFKSQLYQLFCYDDYGQLMKVVDMIEERVGNAVPRYKLQEISEARSYCGINSWYLRRKPNVSEETKKERFIEKFEEWVDGKCNEFIES